MKCMHSFAAVCAGSIRACAGDERVAKLVACLALQVASAGTGAQARDVHDWHLRAQRPFFSRLNCPAVLQPSMAACLPAGVPDTLAAKRLHSTSLVYSGPPLLLVQAKLIQHCARYMHAYLTLLLPHASCPRVTALLGLLAGCGSHEALLPEAADAPAYLCLLTALAGQLSSSAGRGWSEGMAGKAAAHQLRPQLLAACFTSIVEVAAAAETDLRLRFDRQLSAGGSNGGRQGRGRQQTPEQVQSRMESFVRCERGSGGCGSRQLMPWHSRCRCMLRAPAVLHLPRLPNAMRWLPNAVQGGAAGRGDRRGAGRAAVVCASPHGRAADARGAARQPSGRLPAQAGLAGRPAAPKAAATAGGPGRPVAARVRAEAGAALAAGFVPCKEDLGQNNSKRPVFRGAMLRSTGQTPLPGTLLPCLPLAGKLWACACTPP